MRISKVGSVELRQAIIALSTGITLPHPEFAASKRCLIDAGKVRSDQGALPVFPSVGF